MTFVSTIAQTATQTANLKSLQTQLATLQTQIATGHKATDFADLGANTTVSLNARAANNSLDTYLTNITNGNTRINLMTDAINAIQTQVKQVMTSVTGQIQSGDVDVSTLKTLATNSYNAIVAALNSKDGDSYIFAGADTGNAPVANTGSLDAYYTQLNAQWSAGTLTVTPPNTDIADQYIDQSHSIPDVTTGYSGTLAGAKNVAVKADDDVSIDYTVKASDPAFKDILNSLSELKNIASLDSAPGATDADKTTNFYKVFNDISTTLQSASTALNTTTFNLSTAQAQLTNISNDHTNQQTVLNNTLDGIENADMNQVAVQVQALGTQLQASYQVTAMLSKMSLANYLS